MKIAVILCLLFSVGFSSIIVIESEEEMQKMFMQATLGTAEDIIAFAKRFPNYRKNDIAGAFERARVNDLSVIFATIRRNNIPVNEIIRFAEIYGDTASIHRIKIAAENLVLRNTALLRDFRAVFGITDLDERVEQILYRRIMHETDYRNLVAYIEHFPDGKYIRFVSELVENFR